MRNIDRKVWILQGYYQIMKLLEELDYSEVYLAQDIERGVEEYAIKEIELHFETKESLRKALRYFEKVAIRYMDIYHPYLANVKDFFYESGYEYIVMDFVPGRRLQEIIDVKKQPFSEIDIIDIGIMIASALDYLHKKEPPIFFADLFPSNVIITPKGALELTDYGLGKILAHRPADAPFRGTVGYAPPEQYGARPEIDSQTDLYALGAILHQLCTGQHPVSFDGRLPAVRDSNPSISRQLEETIYRVTDYDRKVRYKTATQFLDALTGSREEKPGKSQVKLWLNRILNRRKFEI
jgi:serine/threonine protein kinase